MNNKTQLSIEYLIIISTILIGLTTALYLSQSYITEERVSTSINSIISSISDNAETVALMGYPARQTMNVYVPPNINPNQTYIKNNTINYGVYHQYTGTRDVFELFDYCVKGNLPTREGYYVINILSTGSCVVIDYRNFYINPESVSRIFPKGQSITVSFDIINLLLGEQNMSLTLSGTISSITDLDTSTPGRQTSYDYGTISGGETVTIPVVFYGDNTGIYTGTVYFNNYTVPVYLNVTEEEIVPTTIDNTDVNDTSVYVNETVCFSAEVTNGTHGVSDVWITLEMPSEGCWGINGSCDSSCSYDNLGTIDYYTNPGCNESCNPVGTFYNPSGACSSGGSGNCYKMNNAVSHNTTCTQGSSCETSCSGTPTLCSGLSASDCLTCGCSYEDASCTGSCSCWDVSMWRCQCDSMSCDSFAIWCYGSCDCSQASTQDCCEAHECTWNPAGCSGTPNDCNTYTTETDCNTCGCSWTSTKWYWTPENVVNGYSDYEECEWCSSSNTTIINLTLSDTGNSCSGTSGDGTYGLDYQLTEEGVYTLISGWVNDTLGNTDNDVVNIDINVTSPSVTNTTVFFEDFTPTPYYDYNWSRQGTDWDSVSGTNCYGGSGDCAHADHRCDENNDWIITNNNLIDLNNANNVFVDLYVREDTSFDNNEYFRVWCTDGTNWYKIYEEDMGGWNNDGVWRHRSFTANNNCFISNARFKITIQANHPHEDVHVDDFRIIMESG